MMHYEIKGGVLVGMVTILLFLLVHTIEPRWVLSPWLYWGSILIYLLGMLGVCLLRKRERKGVLPFKNALRSAFVTFLLANLLFFTFYYVLFNFYDPGLVELQKELSKAYLEENYTANELRKHLAILEENDFSVTLSTLISGFGYGAIGGFILSLLLALVVQEQA